jgi:hypothetical protein
MLGRNLLKIKHSSRVSFFYNFVVVQQEKQEVYFRESIEGFPKRKLHRTNTIEKNPLPDAESRSSEFIYIYLGYVCSQVAINFSVD